jgi:outer membrane protein
VTRPKASGSRSAPAFRAAGAGVPPERSPAIRAAAASVRCCLAAAFIVIGVALVLPIAPAAGDPLPQATAAVIDYQRVMREARAAESIRSQIEARRLRYQSEIAEQEHRLVEADRELARQRNILSVEAFNERRKAFEEDVAEVQRMLQTRRQQLDDVAAMAMSEVREAVIQVVGELAEQRGFNLVLPSANVLLFSPQIEITDEVLGKLDERLPEVQVPDRAR